jgi:hypothetical protein
MTEQFAIGVRNVVVDLARNAIVLFPGDRQDILTKAVAQTAVIDIGQRGALIGVEIDSDYYAVTGDGFEPDPLARSSEVDVEVQRGPAGEIQAVTIPRRGEGWEIVFPIGNQCWQQRVNGKVAEACVVTVGR